MKPTTTGQPAALTFDKLMRPATVGTVVPTVAAAPTVAQPVQALARVAPLDYERVGEKAMHTLADVPNKAIAGFKTSNTGEFGELLTGVINLAQKLDPKDMMQPGWRKSLVNRIRGIKHSVMNEFTTIDEQIAKLRGELHAHALSHDQRIKEAVTLYNDAAKAESELTAEVAKLQQHAAQLTEYIASLTDPVDKSTATRHLERCEQRIDLCTRVISIARLSGQKVALRADELKALISKLTEVETTVIPLFMTTFYDFLVNQEMTASADLTASIQQATQEAIRRQAAAGVETTAKIAVATRAAVVDIETMRQLHASFIQQLDVTKTAADAARAQRASDAIEMAKLDEQLKQHLVPLSA